MNETFNSIDAMEEEDKVREIKEEIADKMKDNLKLLFKEEKSKQLAKKVEENAKKNLEP